VKRIKYLISVVSRYLLVLLTFFFCIQSFGQSSVITTIDRIATISPVSISGSGWIISADEKKGVITIEQESLGIVLKNIRLNVESGQGLIVLKTWSAEKMNGRQLVVQTVEPNTTWVFSLNENYILLSCTSAQAVLTADAPASPERVVARLLDQGGVPVNWVGTEEITGWGGRMTSDPSFLPAKNQEVMTFSLGQVSGTNLTSLFDRNKDIAIVFTEQTQLQRNQQNTDLLSVTVPVPGNTIIRLIPDYYTKTLGLPFYSRFDDSAFPSAPITWSTWTAFYDNVTESDVVRTTDWLAANLKPYGFKYVQIDDGYDAKKNNNLIYVKTEEFDAARKAAEHNWITNWDKKKFPHGPQWIANYIKSKGLHPGLWLVPNSYAGGVEKHPDWYLRDTLGNIIINYSTPALDHTNPEVQAWLKTLFTTLKGWGFEYFKFDGEFSMPAYVLGIDKTKLYDKTIDPVIAYLNRLNLIRDVVGSQTFIEGCSSGTPLNGVGYFNSSFYGQDVFNSWQGSYAMFSSINSNAFLNHMVIYLMPSEGIDVSPPMSVEEAKIKMVPQYIDIPKTREDLSHGFGTTLAEAHTLASYVSLTGVVYPLTSVMADLPDDRARLLKMTMPTMPILPVDLYSRGSDMSWDKFMHNTADTYIHNYAEILDLKVNAISGVYDVVALTNWRSEKAIRKISFANKLGLQAGTKYVAFDFWNQKLDGIYTDSITVEIEPHDTRVLQVHPLLDHPQLIGNSRHISGAFSILGLNWDEVKNTISGTSENVIGDTYSLFIYVPGGFGIEQVKADTEKNKEVPAQSELTGNLLKLSFQGQAEKVDWQVQFKLQ
jgi:hypothetical protein